MTEIKRYDVNKANMIGLVRFDEKESGQWVKYEDLAAIQEQLSRYSMSAGQADQRNAESDAVRSALGFSADADDVSPSDLVDAIAAIQEQARALAAECKAVYDHAIEEGYQFYPGGIEYTDAFIREIRAQAVEGFAEHIAFYHSDSKSHALDFAARIRAGEQP